MRTHAHTHTHIYIYIYIHTLLMAKVMKLVHLHDMHLDFYQTVNKQQISRKALFLLYSSVFVNWDINLRGLFNAWSIVVEDQH